MDGFSAVLLDLLAHPNIASKADVVRVYDHEVQGATVVKPLTGAKDDGPRTPAFSSSLGTKGLRGIVLSNGINPSYGQRDPYRMAISAVDEGIRNAVAVGADPNRIALLDNFCWGDPMRAETLGNGSKPRAAATTRPSTTGLRLSPARIHSTTSIGSRWLPPRDPSHVAYLSHRYHRGCDPCRHDGPKRPW